MQVVRQAVGACGNGVIDPPEQCDDGNDLSNDGCSWVCTSETVRISASNTHTLFKRADGSLWTWGDNASGKLGDGTATDRTAPGLVTALPGVKAVAAGASHSLALRAVDGTLWVWGANASGQLGLGTTASSPTPIQVVSLPSVRSVAGGGSFSVAVLADGTVRTWGVNTNGQLGVGTTTSSTSPVQPTVTSAHSAAAGISHALVLHTNGTVSAWGLNTSGQLGDGTTTQRTSPVSVPSLTGVVAVAAAINGNHSLALKSDGTVWAWGANGSGQLGDGSTTNRSTPVQVSGLTGVVAISAGTTHSAALKSDGTVWTWGLNTSGQLGDGTFTRRLNAVQVPGLSNVVALAAGGTHTAVVLADGTARAWGSNGSGQLGDGSVTQRNSPVAALVPFECGNGVQDPGETCDDGNSVNGDGCSAMCQLQSGAPLCGNGTVEAGETCDDGNVASGDGCSQVCASETLRLAAGNTHTLFKRADGTLWTWGDNGSGKLGDGTSTDRLAPGLVTALSGVKTLAGGIGYSMALRGSDGTVWTWGDNGSGQLGIGSTADRPTPIQVPGLSGVVTLATGGSFSLVVLSDGTVRAWGLNSSGQLGIGSTVSPSTSPVQPSGLTHVRAVAAGVSHSLALHANGTVFAWGLNSSGQLGDSSLATRTSPVPVVGLTGMVAVAAAINGNHSLALKADGTVWAWGSNGNGQLGLGTTVDQKLPVQVPGLTGVVAISAGTTHSAALKSDGTVWTWGLNTSGQLGDGTVTRRLSPTQVPGLSNVVALASGGNHTVAVLADGTVRAWGANGSGQLGDGSVTQRTSPVAALVPFECGNGVQDPGEACDDGNFVNGDGCSAMCQPQSGTPLCGNGTVEAGEQCDDGNVASGDGCAFTCQPELNRIQGGNTHTLALRSDGFVHAWGDNTGGKLGDGSTTDRSTPGLVSGLSGVKLIAAGLGHSMALRGSDGTVWTWGDNGSGQLGIGSTADRPTPIQVPGLSGVVTLATGGSFSLVVLSDGTVRAWGLNSSGQLGIGSTVSPSTSPVQPSGLTHVRAVAAGVSHSLALHANGTVFAWGLNSSGQLGDSSLATRTSPVPVVGLTGMVAVAAAINGNHSLALKADGTVWAWGSNGNGQLGLGTTVDQKLPVQVPGLTGVVAISAGTTHSAALKSDGTVWTWGLNTSGQLGDGTVTRRLSPAQVPGLSNVVALTSGGNHTAVIHADGTVRAWGQNSNGQLGDGSTTQRNSPVVTWLYSFCGNGITESGEQCDDGNTSNGDACVQDCRLARCGDGHLQVGVESCDDGNTADNDACPAYCRDLTPGATTPAELVGRVCTALKRGQTNGLRAVSHGNLRPTVQDTFTRRFSASQVGDLEERCAPGDALYDTLLASLSAGAVMLDEAALLRCVAKAEQARVTTTVFDYNGGTGDLAALKTDPDCQAILTGLRPQGQSCTQHWDCAAGLLCQADAATQTVLTCQAPAAANSACGPARVCASGTTCFQGTCKTLGASNAACGPTLPACNVGLTCDDTTLRCRARRAANGACTADTDCANGLTCNAGVCATLVKVADGQACTVDQSVCAHSLSTCRPATPGGATACLPRGGLGAGCGSAEDCRTGLTCEQGMCKPLPGVDEACTIGCRDGLHCGPADVCVAQRAPGATCQQGDACIDGYCAADGTCHAYSNLGEACGTGVIPPVCRQGACVNGTCVGGQVGDSCLERRTACVASLGLVCGPDFTCIAAPGAGQPALEGLCAPGTFRNASNVCELPRAIGAACTGPAWCASGVCLPNGTCGAAPAASFTRQENTLQAFTLGFDP
ncbi:RCC1 domain-containing protein [Pyxidicoccus fallax]|uniref:RCC1 domain-containing protein n=1 Tax=Pyxidicoccus fallax TaxID=394095 RepID=UPI001C1302D9